MKYEVLPTYSLQQPFVVIFSDDTYDGNNLERTTVIDYIGGLMVECRGDSDLALAFRCIRSPVYQISFVNTTRSHLSPEELVELHALIERNPIPLQVVITLIERDTLTNLTGDVSSITIQHGIDIFQLQEQMIEFFEAWSPPEIYVER